jgi:methylthioribose-1-phosphate isomerase
MSLKDLGSRTIVLRRTPKLTVITIDQTKLPQETLLLEMENHYDVAEAIRTMKIRGAPLLGATAAFALALAAYNSKAKTKENLMSDLKKAAATVRATRPTAANLFWALDRILDRATGYNDCFEGLATFVADEAQRIADEDVVANRSIGMHGAELVRDGDVLLTHCNAGALATVAYGTALGVVRAVLEQGKRVKVFATETRPLLQGARLTTYELRRDGVPVTLITDSMVGYIMRKRLVNKVVVGADRIVRDAVINKIGTFAVAVLAKEHNIPFYVAAPKSTFDLTRTSDEVTIEQRSPDEITHIGMQRIAPEGISVLNPAFDITPLEYVAAIICESGILYEEDFRKFKAKQDD